MRISLGKDPLVPLTERLGGLQSWSGCVRENKQLLPVLKIKPNFYTHPSCCIVTILTALPWLFSVTCVYSKKVV